MAKLNETRAITMASLLAGLAMAAIPAWAQTNAPAPTDQGSGMMRREMPKGEGMKPGMMTDPETRQKMSRMMDNCNRMMESIMPNQSGSTAPNKG